MCKAVPDCAMKAYIGSRCIAALILKHILLLNTNPVICNMLLMLKFPYYVISLLSMP